MNDEPLEALLDRLCEGDPEAAAQVFLAYEPFLRLVVRRHLPDPAYRIFLFGSRATGAGRPNSDIDVGIEGPGPVPREALAAIDEELEEAPTLYTIDVVDFARLPEGRHSVSIAWSGRPQR